MRRICAWGGKDLGEREPLEDNSITHGICVECKDKEIAKMKADREKDNAEKS